MSNAAKNEVLSSFRETINNSLAEMDHRKLKHLFTPGGVRIKTAMHYFDEFPTWRNFVVMRAVFRVSLIIVCTTFAGLFSATILDLESSGIVK